MVNQVSIPEGLAWQCPSRQQIIRIQSDIISKTDLVGRLTSQQNRYPVPRRTELVLELSSPTMLRDFSNVRWFGPRIRVLISDHQIAEIHSNRSHFHRIRPTLVLNHCEGSLPRIIQFLASLNLPIEISPAVFADQDEKTLLDLAERLLFSPFVKTPVQPFFNLLLSVLSSQGNFPHTLWDTCNESVGQNFFVTNSGKITLSSRWSDNNRYFGDISDTVHDVRSSRLFNELKSFKDQNSAENINCHECSVFCFCSGYLCALDSTHDCSPFQSLYGFFSSHSQSLKKSYNTLTKQKRNDVLQAIQMPIPDRYQ